MSRTLTPSQITTIKSTAPLLTTHAPTITTQMYTTLLSDHPSLHNTFNTTHQATGHQALALAGALTAYATHIDDLGVLSPVIERICHKHASLGIAAPQYEIVGTYLLAAMREVLGAAVATDEVMEAWAVAYWQLADVLIGREKQLYEETRAWNGWQDFKITRKEKEAEGITSFHLEPVDAKLKIPMFRPGQYVSVNVFVKELEGGVWQARQYSLSDAPGKKCLRISVKKEPGIEVGEPKYVAHPGYLSNILHDTKSVGDVVKVTHPFGDFYFEEKEGEGEAPVVLLSVGVGLTCLVSILNTLVETGSSRPVSWIHGARDSKTRAFRRHIDGLAAEHGNLHTLYFSSAPQEDEVKGRDYHVNGRLDLDSVSKELLFTENDKTRYFVCGPVQFMVETEAKLKSFGVSSDRISMELFGTGGVSRV